MKTVTTKQALLLLGERGINISYPTIAQWVREGRFEGAERDETERGPVWRIPVASLRRFEQPKTGRPKSNPEAVDDDAKTVRRRGTNAVTRNGEKR